MRTGIMAWSSLACRLLFISFGLRAQKGRASVTPDEA